MNMICLNCSQELQLWMKFCPYCGNMAQKLCPICKIIYLENYFFCPHCCSELSAIPTEITLHQQVTKPITPNPIISRAASPQQKEALANTSSSALEINATKEDLRKHATVLFTDVKGSTKLVEGLDPEEAKNILSPILEAMRNAILKFEGTIIKTAGDGLIAVFGAPRAMEDHALRACLAALSMQNNIASINPEIQIRVGINSGEIYLEALEDNKYDIAGPTVNLAARMEQTAAPGFIQLTRYTLNLVEDEVQVSPQGEQEIKGFSQPIAVFHLDGIIKKKLNEAKDRPSFLPFIGRENEITTLNKMAEQVMEGRGHTICLVAKAGQGKTRLLYEFIHGDRGEKFEVLMGYAYPHTRNIPYAPIIEILETWMGLSEKETEESAYQKILPFLTNITSPYALQALMSFIGVTVTDAEWIKLDLPLKKKYAFDAIIGMLFNAATIKPLIIVIENLYCIDSETEIFLDALISQIEQSRVFLIGTTRPGYIDHWLNRPTYTQIELTELPSNAEQLALDQLLGKHPSLTELKTRLINACVGNPFFLEQMVKSLIQERILIETKHGFQLSEDVVNKKFQLPESIFTLLQTQVDNLPTLERKILRVAAVIGERFSCNLVAKVIDDESQEKIQEGIRKLIDIQYIYETHIYPTQKATFKHALIHEVAYNSILKSIRRSMHLKILSILESSPKEEQDIQLQAFHAFQAENWEKTFEYNEAAAKEIFLVFSANKTAANLYERALIAAEYLPKTKEIIEKILYIYFYLITIYRRLGKLPDEGKYVKLAESLSSMIEEKSDLSVTFQLYSFVYDMSIGEISRGLNSISGLPEQCNDMILKSLVLALCAMFSVFAGNYDDAEKQSFEGYKLLQTVDSRYPLFPLPPGYFSLWMYSWSRSYNLHIDQSTLEAEVAELLTKTNTSQTSLPGVYILFAVGVLYYAVENYDKALEHLSRALSYAVEVELYIYLPWVYATVGCTYLRLNQWEKGKEMLEKALDIFNKSESYLLKMPSFIAIAEGLFLLGDYQATKNFVEPILQFSIERKLLGYEAYLSKILAEIDLHSPNPDYPDIKKRLTMVLEIGQKLNMQVLIKQCLPLLEKINTLEKKLARLFG